MGLMRIVGTRSLLPELTRTNAQSPASAYVERAGSITVSSPAWTAVTSSRRIVIGGAGNRLRHLARELRSGPRPSVPCGYRGFPRDLEQQRTPRAASLPSAARHHVLAALISENWSKPVPRSRPSGGQESCAPAAFRIIRRQRHAVHTAAPLRIPPGPAPMIRTRISLFLRRIFAPPISADRLPPEGALRHWSRSSAPSASYISMAGLIPVQRRPLNEAAIFLSLHGQRGRVALCQLLAAKIRTDEGPPRYNPAPRHVE